MRATRRRAPEGRASKSCRDPGDDRGAVRTGPQIARPPRPVRSPRTRPDPASRPWAGSAIQPTSVSIPPRAGLPGSSRTTGSGHRPIGWRRVRRSRARGPIVGRAGRRSVARHSTHEGDHMGRPHRRGPIDDRHDQQVKVTESEQLRTLPARAVDIGRREVGPAEDVLRRQEWSDVGPGPEVRGSVQQDGALLIVGAGSDEHRPVRPITPHERVAERVSSYAVGRPSDHRLRVLRPDREARVARGGTDGCHTIAVVARDASEERGGGAILRRDDRARPAPEVIGAAGGTWLQRDRPMLPCEHVRRDRMSPAHPPPGRGIGLVLEEDMEVARGIDDEPVRIVHPAVQRAEVDPRAGEFPGVLSDCHRWHNHCQ